MQALEHLFVYGTLQRGRSARAAWLATRAVWRGPAYASGRLISLGAYPALLPARHADEVVHGEIWQLSDASLLDELDRYEGCHVTDPLPHEYVRAVIPVQAQGPAILLCWAYLYPWGEQGREILSGGRW